MSDVYQVIQVVLDITVDLLNLLFQGQVGINNDTIHLQLLHLRPNPDFYKHTVSTYILEKFISF